MHYQEFPPSPHLAQHVQCYWTLEGEHHSVEPGPEPIFPDGCSEIIFNLASQFRRHTFEKIELQPLTIVVGQMTRFVLVEPPNRVKLFGIRFHPTGLYPLVKQPMSDLTDTIERIDSVLGRAGREIEERINEAATDEERISIFERIYTKIVMQSQPESNLAGFATRIIFDSGGQMPVESLAANFGTNVKQLERQFARHIGLTPKRFSRIVRIQNIVQTLNRSAVESWPDAALSFGYFDQSHFINDFKQITGTTPDVFVRQQNQITDFFIS